MKASVDNRMEACEERDGPALSQAGTLYMIWKTSAIKVVVIHVHVCTKMEHFAGQAKPSLKT